MVLPDNEVCERARLSRDPRFDGRFVTAVLTTGIYCRPVCPARPPARENVRYFATAAAAQEAGYRPCLRCRPEDARRLPEWTVGSQTAVRGLRLIDAGYLNDHGVEDLAARLGCTGRHLNRIFRSELGATPATLGRAHRVQLAKRLIDAGGLSLSDVAMHAGYGSQRRFNDEMKAVFGCPPSRLRRSRTQRVAAPLKLVLSVRKPYHADWVFGYLARRALAGLEAVQGHSYKRRLGGHGSGRVEVRWDAGRLTATVPPSLQDNLGQVLRRIRRLFDCDADSAVIDSHLSGDGLIGCRVRATPGLRVPGAWDGFETAVRAVLGQQVSIARATRLAELLMDRFGSGAFPSPAVLAAANPAEIGLPGRRGEAIRRLAAGVEAGSLQLDECVDSGILQERLRSLPGIGAWTASYIALRVARDPNAFPESDWGVLKALGTTAAGARRRAQAWAPWRGYALMYLWHGGAERHLSRAVGEARK